MMAYFKYDNVTDSLRQNILSGVYPQGSKIPTESELCRTFSVSRRTVRKALAMLQQEGFLLVQQGSGAYVAEWEQRGKAENQSVAKNIAVVLTDVERYIYPAVLKGINNELLKGQHGLTLRITENSVFNEAKVIESLLCADIDAVILDPARSALTDANGHLYQKLVDKMPCITIHSRIPDLPIPAITIADEVSFSELTQHVIDKGHTKLAGIFNYDEFSGKQRFKGLLHAARAANLDLDEGNILWVSRPQLVEASLDHILDRFWDHNRGCTAFLCVNDHVAARLIACLTRRGVRVPLDVSVTGFDNAPVVSDQITTMTHPQETMGVLAVQKLFEHMANPRVIGGYEFRPTLIDRHSVADVRMLRNESDGNAV